MRLAVNQDVAGSIPAWPANILNGFLHKEKCAE
jgi:hypothetical protein